MHLVPAMNFIQMSNDDDDDGDDDDDDDDGDDDKYVFLTCLFALLGCSEL